MRQILGLVLMLSLGLLPQASQAQSSDSTSALAEMASKVRTYTLKNGLRVILYNRGEAPVFSGAVVVRVGGSDEVVGETGISRRVWRSWRLSLAPRSPSHRSSKRSGTRFTRS
jgi:hypothetical protein